MRRRPLSAALILLAAALPRAGAATLPSEPPLPPVLPTAPRPAPPSDALPPYQDNLERLAETLGVLAFMRDLCGTDTGPDWRAQMAGLVDAEGATDERRSRLAGRFNRGYESYRLTYSTCTSAARLVVARSLAEGARLSLSLQRLFTVD